MTTDPLGGDDKVVWTANSIGHFSIKSAWDELVQGRLKLVGLVWFDLI